MKKKKQGTTFTVPGPGINKIGMYGELYQHPLFRFLDHRMVHRHPPLPASQRWDMLSSRDELAKVPVLVQSSLVVKGLSSVELLGPEADVVRIPAAGPA